MLKVLLICTSGISTNLLIRKIEEAAKKKQINAQIWATSEADMKIQIPKADIVMLGPQSRYLKSTVEALADKKPVVLIDMMDYGTMNGEAVLTTIVEYLKL